MEGDIGGGGGAGDAGAFVGGGESAVLIHQLILMDEDFVIKLIIWKEVGVTGVVKVIMEILEGLDQWHLRFKIGTIFIIGW